MIRALLMVYPFWAATAAMSFLAHATEAGMYYMIGGILFAVSILLAVTPTWAPLEVAFVMTVNMTAQALYLRGQSKQPPAGTSGPLGAAAATTVKSGG
jgi:hypothetical protein